MKCNAQNDHQRNLQLFIFLDNLYLSFCAYQMLLVDEDGTKLGSNYLTRAESLLPRLDKNQRQDHILHVELRYITIKLRSIILQQNDNDLKVMKTLYKNSRKINKKCDNSCINCFRTNNYLEMIYLTALARFGETDRKNEVMTKVQEMFEMYPQHNTDPFIKYQLDIFYNNIMEMYTAQNDAIQTDKYAETILKRNPDPVLKALALQRQIIVRLNKCQTFLTSEETNFINQLVRTTSEQWQLVQQTKTSAKRHHQYLTFLILVNYNLYKRSDDQEDKLKYGQKVAKIFEQNCSKTVFGSLDFINVDVSTTYLEICFELQKYDKILEFCDNIQKGKSSFNFPFNFKELLNVVHSTAKLGKITIEENWDHIKVGTEVKKLEKLMTLLAESNSCRKYFWYSSCLKFQYDFHKAVGSPQKFQEIRLASNYFLPSLYDKCNLIDIGSNSSSITSINEVIEVKLKSAKFTFVEIFNVVDESRMKYLRNMMNTSVEQFKQLMKRKFLLTDDNFEEVNWISAEEIKSGKMSRRSQHCQIFVILQVAGLNVSRKIRFVQKKICERPFQIASFRIRVRSEAVCSFTFFVR